VSLYNFSIPQLENFFKSLPITEETYYMFYSLLSLDYSIFKPLLDLLFAGKIEVYDLMPYRKPVILQNESDFFGVKVQCTARCTLPELISTSEMVALIDKNKSFSGVAEADLKASIIRMVTEQKAPEFVVVPMDMTGVNSNPMTGEPSITNESIPLVITSDQSYLSSSLNNLNRAMTSNTPSRVLDRMDLASIKKQGIEYRKYRDGKE